MPKNGLSCAGKEWRIRISKQRWRTNLSEETILCQAIQAVQFPCDLQLPMTLEFSWQLF
jgi:hypothetical protein